MAKNDKTFDINKHDGLIHYDCLCIRGKKFEKLLRETYDNVNMSDVIECLKNQDALKLGKHKNTVKVSTLNKTAGSPRFYAIWLKNLK